MKEGEDIDGGVGSDIGPFLTQLLRVGARCSVPREVCYIVQPYAN